MEECIILGILFVAEEAAINENKIVVDLVLLLVGQMDIQAVEGVYLPCFRSFITWWI